MKFELDRVSLRYPGRRGVEALRDLSLAVDAGEHVSLMGASGCGKSTLLRVIAGLQKPTTGRVRADGRDLAGTSPRDRSVGMVLQDAPLYAHMTVRDNLAFPLRTRGTPARPARTAAEQLAERLRLTALLDSHPAEISGGERRRAALGRALITKPALLLLDEPFASLDPPLRLSLRTLVREVTTSLACACIHATHDGAEAMSLGSRLVVLDAGRVVDDGPPQQVWRDPACVRSAELLGAAPMNILSVASTQGLSTQGLMRSPAPGLRLGVRAEHLLIGDGSSGKEGDFSATGAIIAEEPIGEEIIMVIRADGISEPLRALWRNSRPPGVGARVTLHAAAADLRWFDDTPAGARTRGR